MWRVEARLGGEAAVTAERLGARAGDDDQRACRVNPEYPGLARYGNVLPSSAIGRNPPRIRQVCRQSRQSVGSSTGYRRNDLGMTSHDGSDNAQ